MHRTLLLLITLAALALARAACADERAIHLRDAPELPRVHAACAGCHSLDYIEMNAPFLNRAAWEAEVRKMVKVMGAPVREEDVAPLVDYLTSFYGLP